MNDKVLVTVLCKTFNHEKYIKDALDGFVKQKTSFKFKIIVQDDASTDKTAEIVKSYESQYPELFDNIYHKTNQYSQRINTDYKYIKHKLEGKYIAYCEGDDFWKSENKLQTCIDFLESNKNYAMVCHKFDRIRANDKKYIDTKPLLSQDRDISDEEIIMGSVYMQLASQVFKIEVFKERPDFFFESAAGDYKLNMFSMFYGKAHYIDSNMSNYRILANGSWSEETAKDQNRLLYFNEQQIKFMKEFDLFSKGKYSIFINKKIDELIFYNCIYRKDYINAKNTNYFKSNSSIGEKMEITIGGISPDLAIFIRDLYRKLRYRNRTVK